MKPPFDDLIDQHGPEIHRYLWRLLRDRNDTDDCYQETFLRAFKAYTRLDTDAHFRGWLFKIATNAARTLASKRSRNFERNRPLGDNLPLGGSAPPEMVAQNELVHAVAAVVQGLPHKQRAALLMRKYQGLDYAEIASALDTTEQSARASVYQAVKKLKAWYEQSEWK